MAEIDGRPMARWPWQQCPAHTGVRPGTDWGRCDLRRGHDGDHALERGMYDVRWRVTEVDTAGQPLAPLP